jgi:hypothetical protein
MAAARYFDLIREMKNAYNHCLGRGLPAYLQFLSRRLRLGHETGARTV